MAANKPFDVAVIGAGVIGCGVARALTLKGFKVVLLERDDAVAAGWASGGNTGRF
jgi:glycerol-3-phosphate dehydrogenase